MSDSFLSFVNSASFRNQLITRNLQPYNVPGVFSSNPSPQNYETNLTDSNVVDSPDTLISSNNFANSLYPLNEYGPDQGFEGKYSVPGSPYPVDSNSGPYDLNDANIDLVSEFFIDAAYVQNIYGPEGGYSNLVVITDVVGSPKLYKPYWDPSSFVASTYTPYNLVFSDNPTGTNGPLSQDTYLAKIGAQQLKFLFQERIAAEVKQRTVGRLNLDTLQDPFTATLIATGKEPLVDRNWTITEPESPIAAAADFALKLSGSYFPASLIPGDYFNDVNIQAPKLEKGLNVVNNLTGGLLGPVLDVFRNPSETFVANTGNGQRSILFSSLDYNKYRPKYTRGPIQSITTGLDRLLDPDKPNTGGYYVGSPNAEPSQIDSPANQIPVGPGGKQISSIVYGPQELGILYEGNETKLNDGLKGKSLSDGGGITGQFVWTSPKYKDNAGFKQGVNGVVTNLDSEFETIRADYSQYESTRIEFKEGSILDDTQRLIESADNVTGLSRLKHVGNAINQVSKVFNDGYKELTKGSQVLSYKDDSDGSERGIEYCRIFTKDTPYYTYADLQKSDGITTKNRGFTYSVFDNTYNLNIAPLKNPGSTNIFDNKVKKYMFSIENLAWRTSDRPGYTYDDLPVCERGPNGGRIMWFPPYGLTFNDDSKPTFNQTEFLGRPEPVYTYKNTSRSGSISWKIIVDHPAVMNTIVQKQLKNIDPATVDSMVNSFFAGCLKYDLYELGIKFNTIPTRDLFTYQEILNNPRLTAEELGQVAFEIPKDPVKTKTGSGDEGNPVVDENKSGPPEVKTEPAVEDVDLSKFVGYGWYFDNNSPNSTVGKNTYGAVATNDFEFWYNAYLVRKENEYKNLAPEKAYLTEDATEGPRGGVITYNGNAKEYLRSSIPDFFSQVIEGNFNQLKGEFLTKIKEVLNQGGTIELDLVGSASATASVSYNVDISKRRNDSVLKWLSKQEVTPGTTIQKYIDDKKLILKFTPRGEEIVIPKTNAEAAATTDVDDIAVNSGGTSDNILAASVDCRVNVREKVGTNQYKRTYYAEWYSIPPMACRRVAITRIKATKPVETTTTTTTAAPNTGGGNEEVTVVENVNPTSIKPSPNITIEQKIKDGISKKILRFLFSECDYFEVLKNENPMVYQSIKDKIRFFNPAFHSTTPEGLNARLTFLNQCVRPGQTIPIIGADGRPKYNDALNTSFGAPPILVLRVGDFYHSKIVPNSLTFKYGESQYDINPEGIGIQPMIVDVTMGFDFIGGHGLKQPVEELQNALSFNYYANTEIYDERATPTEDTSARDKYVVEKILAKQPPVTVTEVVNTIPEKGGSAIGTVISDTEIDYTAKLNEFWEATKGYFEAYVDTNTSVMKNFNIGIVDLLFKERNYTKGSFDEYGEPKEIEIYGKPKDVEKKVDKLFELTIGDIKGNGNPFMDIVKANQNLADSDKREIENRLIQYVESTKGDFSLNLNNEFTSFVTLQQDYVQLVRQFNVILTKTDGEKVGPPQSGPVKVYTLSGETFDSFKNVVSKIADKHIEFYKVSEAQGINQKDSVVNAGDMLNLRLQYYELGDSVFTDAKAVNVPPFSDDTGFKDDDKQENRFYQIMASVFIDENKTKSLQTFLLESTVFKDKTKVEESINQAIDNCKNRYNNYSVSNNDFYSKVKTRPEFTKILESPLEDDQKYIFKYTSKIETSGEQRDRLLEIFSNVNTNSSFETFKGKVKFN